MTGLWRLPFLCMFLFTARANWAQSSPSPSPLQASASVAAVDLVRAASANELAALGNSAPKHFFRSVKHRAQGSQTRLYVETRAAMVAMTIAYDDKPLTPQQLQGEEDHLNYLLHDPSALRAKQAREAEDADRTRRILKALPDAFLYDYDGSEPGTAEIARPGITLMRLRFRPNPDYSPPSRIEQALTGMQGHVLLEASQHRLALFDATLIKDVSFGWGFLGHLDKGGNIQLRQAALDDGSWSLNRLKMKFTGKILIFKSLNVDSDEVLDQFRSVPSDTTFAQGVAMLKTSLAEDARR